MRRISCIVGAAASREHLPDDADGNALVFQPKQIEKSTIHKQNTGKLPFHLVWDQNICVFVLNIGTTTSDWQPKSQKNLRSTEPRPPL